MTTRLRAALIGGNLVFLLAASQATASAQTDSGRLRLGLSASRYEFTNSRTRERFGGGPGSLGLQLDAATSRHGGWTPSLSLIYRGKGHNHMFLAPVGVAYRAGISSGKLVPYAGAGANLVLSHIRASDGIRSGLGAAVGGNVAVGVASHRGDFFEVRYQRVSRVSSFDPSGFNFTAGLRF